jgi:DNA-binding CsgD family transcriptional regulator
LTPRQQDVLALLRQGLTHEEIAQRLGITPDGVKYHVSDILRRLQVDSRYEAAAWRPEHAPARRPWTLALAPFGTSSWFNAKLAAKAAGAAFIVAVAVGVAVLLWAVLATDATDEAPTLQDRIATGNAVAYAVVSRQFDLLGGGLGRVWTIGVVDPSSGVVSSFEVGDVIERPYQAAIAGDEIVINMSTKIVAYRRDSTGRRAIHQAPANGGVIGIATSPDGQRLAITEQVEDPCPVPDEPSRDSREVTRLKVIDIRTGDEQFDFGRDNPAFAAFPGQPYFVTWRADGRGIVVEAHTGDEAPAVIATVMLDGTVTIDDSRGFWLKVSPSGEAILNTPEVICDGLDLSQERHELSVTELVTGHQLARLSDPSLSFMPVAWSPDGRQLMYKTYTMMPDEQRPACPLMDPATVRWHTLDLGSGSSDEAASRSEIEQRSYGDAALSFSCHGEPIEEAYCLGEGHEDPVDVYADGVQLASGTEFRLIGSAPRW